MPTVSLSYAQAGEQITRDDLTWNTNVGDPLEITYGFRSEAPLYNSQTHNQQGTWFTLDATMQGWVEAALQLWADVANITFVYDAGGAIQFSGYTSSTDGHMAFAYYPGDQAYTDQDGDVWLNNYYYAYSGIPDGMKFRTIVHEIGHALGLEHPGDYDAGEWVSYSESAEYIEDTRQYTVMSYASAASTGAYHAQANASTPLLHDIAAIQRLYGANTSYHSGDDVYGFSGTDARFTFTSDAADDDTHVFAVWDSGGIDTFDFSGFTHTQVIDLRPEMFSDVGNLTKNVVIAAGVVIENAIGGSNDNLINGNDYNNSLSGLGGSDVLNGYAGSDTLIGGGGVDFITGGSGTDFMYGGSGSDRFIFVDISDSVTGTGRDWINFSTGNNDRVDLSAIDAKTTVAGDQAFTFITTTFTGNAGQLRVTNGGVLQGDVNGDSVADFSVDLDNPVNITASDFIL